MPLKIDSILNFRQILAVALIFAGLTVAWYILGASLALRTDQHGATIDEAIEKLWGPPLLQNQPKVTQHNSDAPNDGREMQPARSEILVKLSYQPKRKGLFRYRTFQVEVSASYLIRNSTATTQAMDLEFPLPADTSYSDFKLEIDGTSKDIDPNQEGIVSTPLELLPGAERSVRIQYKTQGRNRWEYRFQDIQRVENFHLAITTDYDDIDFPLGTASPNGNRTQLHPGWEFHWNYAKWLNPPGVGMEMPRIVNPGRIAARVTYFAPIALLFFFAVLTILCALRSLRLHPMHYLFLGTACFAFQLLFAYSVDLLPPIAAFCIAAIVSLGLNLCYLGALANWALAIRAGLAQFAYLVLFSYSFFFEGLTGITITVGSIVTLGFIMMATVKAPWEQIFQTRPAVGQ